jgi:hypothetical protein
MQNLAPTRFSVPQLVQITLSLPPRDRGKGLSVAKPPRWESEPD